MTEESARLTPAIKKTKPKDPVFKRLMQTYFEQEQLNDTFTVTPGIQVGQLQLEIDITIKAVASLGSEEIQTKLSKTPFWFFNRYNLVEFKSISDSLDEGDFARIVARAHLAWSERPPEVARSEVVSCIITAAKPRDFLKEIRPGGRSFRQIRPGVYYHTGFLFPNYLIVCNLLSIEESNYPLLVFSSGKTFKAYLEQVIDSDLEMYLNYAVRLHPQETAEILRQRRKTMTIKEKEKVWKILMETYSVKEVLEIIGRERFVEELGPDYLSQILTQVVEEHDPDYLSQLFSQLVKKIGPERTAEILNASSGSDGTPSKSDN